MSPGQTGHITGQMGRVPGTDGTHTRGCPAKILYVYWFFSFPKNNFQEVFFRRGAFANCWGGVAWVLMLGGHSWGCDEVTIRL